MNTLIGLIIIAIGSFGQSSSYVPINKVKNWSWVSFWLVQGIFAWLVFPLLGALLAVPEGSSLIELWGSGGALPAIIYGVLWGVGGLTFGLSMRYLGVALGQSIALGTCAGFGTLFPAIFDVFPSATANASASFASRSAGVSPLRGGVSFFLIRIPSSASTPHRSERRFASSAD